MKVAPEDMDLSALGEIRCTEVVIFVVVDGVPKQALRVPLDEPIPVLPATRLDFDPRPIFATDLVAKEVR